MKKRICVVTGSRSEYGLLAPLLRELKLQAAIKLQIIATGMHLSPVFGLTYRDIENDGFYINEKVNISLVSDTPLAISRSTALAVKGFAKAYEKLKPDIVVLLGDRFEILGASIAACIARIPIAHINGGEATEGAFDEAFRHSITKMSQLHFTSAKVYRKRVIQLGENPKRVFNVGALGIDNIRNLKLLGKKELEKRLGFTFAQRNLLVTFHPVTLESNTSQGQFKNLLSVLDGLENTHIIFTKTNADTCGRVINKLIDKYVSKNKDKAKAFISMGQLLYLSAMRFVDAVVGNSSSGIIEAPSFKVDTINIGDRQKGRIHLNSIIDCKPTKEGIAKAFKVLYSERFRQNLRNIRNPYGDGKAAKRIAKILKKYDINSSLKKHFYDINFKI